ncbi:MAG: glycosyltransferase family 9 protein [bacterium]
MRGNRTFKFIDRWIGIPLVGIAGAARLLGGRGRRSAGVPLGPGDRVLVVKQAALGDTLLLLPVLKALKDRVGPQGRVVLVATPVNREVAEACPWVDRVLLLDPERIVSRPQGLAGLIRRLRGERFALALDFDQWLRSSALLATASGAARRLGFRTSGQHRHHGFDGTVDQAPGVHEGELFARLAVAAGIDAGAIEPYPGFLRRHGIWCDGPRPDAGGDRPPRIVFHPGCGSHGWQREWPLESYAELGALLQEGTGADVVVTGHGTHEVSLANELQHRGRFSFTNLAGRMSFRELADQLVRSDLVVCGNTGVMHLAAGLGVPLAALHGPTDPVKWGPNGGSPEGDPRFQVVAADLPCSPCLFLGFEYGCPERPCMESLAVETVMQACQKALQAGRP